MRRISGSILCLVALLGVTGCGAYRDVLIGLEPDPLASPAREVSLPLYLAPVRDDRVDREYIGRFVVGIATQDKAYLRTERRLEDEVFEEVAGALDRVGYAVQPTNGETPPDGPVVVVSVEDFQFGFYQSFYVVTPTSGWIVMRVSVITPDGRRVVDETLSARGMSACMTSECGFRTATGRALKRVLDDLVELASSEAFEEAVRRRTDGV